MNRADYMKQLAYKLRRLPRPDYDRAMEYFYEYFEEAGTENEQQAIEDLGTPQQAAEQIIQDIARENLTPKNEPRSVRRSLSTVWIVILAIFASPIALPLALAFILVLLCAVLCAFMFILCIILAAISTIATGVIAFFCGIFLLFVSFPSGLSTLGLSLVCLGLSVFIAMASIKLTRWVWDLLRKLMRRFVKGGKQHD